MLDVSRPFCCGVESVYVDNIPGKEYFYCRSCKLEVYRLQDEVARCHNIITLDDFRPKTPRILNSPWALAPVASGHNNGHITVGTDNFCMLCGTQDTFFILTPCPGSSPP